MPSSHTDPSFNIQYQISVHPGKREDRGRETPRRQWQRQNPAAVSDNSFSCRLQWPVAAADAAAENRYTDPDTITSGLFMIGSSRWCGRCQGQAGLRPVLRTPGHRPAAPALETGMNDPEVIMPNSPATNRFIAHDAALEAAAAAITLVKRIPAPLKSIADQVIRSAASVPANLAEGQGRTGGGIGVTFLEDRLRLGEGGRQPPAAARRRPEQSPHSGRRRHSHGLRLGAGPCSGGSSTPRTG